MPIAIDGSNRPDDYKELLTSKERRLMLVHYSDPNIDAENKQVGMVCEARSTHFRLNVGYGHLILDYEWLTYARVVKTGSQ